MTFIYNNSKDSYSPNHDYALANVDSRSFA